LRDILTTQLRDILRTQLRDILTTQLRDRVCANHAEESAMAVPAAAADSATRARMLFVMSSFADEIDPRGPPWSVARFVVRAARLLDAVW